MADEMTNEDRNVKWTNFPIYSERINKAAILPDTVGAITPLYPRMRNGLPDCSSDTKLSAADAIRAATYIVSNWRWYDYKSS